MKPSYELYAKIRDAKGLRDSDVAKMTGISSGTISDWKKGRYDLKTEKLIKIADALGVSVDLLSGRQQHYMDDETAEIAQWVFENQSGRLLFKAARRCSPDSILLAAQILEKLKETNPDG